jgi:predicted ATPase/DNA-binding XRE family transcriptional regulator
VTDARHGPGVGGDCAADLEGTLMLDADHSTVFGRLLKEYRLRAGLTQEALAEWADMGRRSIQGLERGESRPQRETVQRLARALALSPQEQERFEEAAQPSPRRRRAVGILHVLNRPADPRDNPPRHNLPVQLTSFIGREREVAEVSHLLARTRLLTLTGTGGCGKTRIALRVAGDLGDAYPDGIWLVELAPLADPALVATAVGAAVGVREGSNRPFEEVLVAALRDRFLLLVLDNCEHLIAACARIADALLRGCPSLTILATSREALQIAGEVSWRVPSLGVPDDRPDLSTDVIAASEAVRLFVERAAAAQPGFHLSEHNATTMARICARLDGIPLAIELAATRVKSLSLQEIAGRLDKQFRLLTGGSRVALPRQQTLRAMVDWSYDLLTPAQRTLFNRLSAFAGGVTLEAAEMVCGDEDVVDVLGELVDKSLVVAEGKPGEITRYTLLETLRQYASERLEATGEAEALRSRHAAYYSALALEVEPYLRGPQQLGYLARLDLESDNLRAALRWYLDRRQAHEGLQLTLALLWFRWFRGAMTENRFWVDQLLALPEASEPSALRATALAWTGRWAWVQGDWVAWRRLAEEAIAIARDVGDRPALAEALLRFGISADQQEARRSVELSLDLFRRLGDQWKMTEALTVLGRVALADGDRARARVYLEESLAIARKLGERHAIAFALEVLGEVETTENPAEARAYLEESLALNGEVGDHRGIASAQYYLGRLDYLDGHDTSASDHFRASLRVTKALPWTERIVQALDGLAAVAARQGNPERALRVARASAHLRDAAAIRARPSELSELQDALLPARRTLGVVACAAAEDEGQAMTLQQAVEYALEENGG